MEGIVPYRSSEFEVNPVNYQPWRDTEEMEDTMIQKMVDQTLMSVLSTVSEEVSMDKSRSKPIKMVIRNVQYTSSNGTSPLKSAKNKKERRQKKSRREEVGSDVTVNEPMISIPASKFKSMVLSEVESRATRVHDYYSYQWNDIQRDRLQLYADLIRFTEKDRRLEEQLGHAIAEIHCLQNENEKLNIELDDIKNAKKKKRKDAKLRRNKDKEPERQADSAQNKRDIAQEAEMPKEGQKDDAGKDGNKKVRKGKHGKKEKTRISEDALQAESNKMTGSKTLRDKAMLNKLLDQKEATSISGFREKGTGDDGQLIVQDDNGCVTTTSIVELNSRLKGVARKSDVKDAKSKEENVALVTTEDHEGLDSGEPAEPVNDVSKSGVKKQEVEVGDETNTSSVLN